MNASSPAKDIPGRRPGSYPFGARLTLLVMLTASVALLLSSASLVAYNILSTRRAIVNELLADAEAAATASAMTLAFDDRASADENLAIFRNKPRVTAAGLYDEEGALFASYIGAGGSAAPLPAGPGEAGTRFTDDRVEIFQDVVFGGESIGTVYIGRDLLDVEETVRRTTWIVVVVFTISLFLAMVSTHHFKRRLVRPIDELVKTAAAVSRSQDYSQRAAKLDDDELGALTDAFNTMVTTIDEHDRERRQLVAELEAKNAELERFTYTVSHDLKSPLVTISGFLGLLAQDAFEGNRESLANDIAVIRQATQTMRSLLDDLLELSRIGRIANPSESFHLRDLVDETLTVLQGAILEKGVQVRTEVQAGLPTILADRARIREVVQNLVENAIKFMDGKSVPRVDISISQVDGDIVCSVRDNGRGIDPRYQEKIFGLFERIDQDVEGTGVGLALIQRIVDFHGGRVWVESEGLGHGSTFTFTLPVHGTTRPGAPDSEKSADARRGLIRSRDRAR